MYSKIWFRGSSNLLSELWQSTLWRTLSRLPTQPGHRPNQFSPRPRVEIVNRHCYPFAILLYTSLRGSVRCRWPCDHRPSSTDTPPPPPPPHFDNLICRAIKRNCGPELKYLREVARTVRNSRARISVSDQPCSSVGRRARGSLYLYRRGRATLMRFRRRKAINPSETNEGRGRKGWFGDHSGRHCLNSLWLR